MKKYIILMHTDTEVISDIVERKINAGWNLYGTPFSRPAGICQAMTKDENDA